MSWVCSGEMHACRAELDAAVELFAIPVEATLHTRIGGVDADARWDRDRLAVDEHIEVGVHVIGEALAALRAQARFTGSASGSPGAGQGGAPVLGVGANWLGEVESSPSSPQPELPETTVRATAATRIRAESMLGGLGRSETLADSVAAECAQLLGKCPGAVPSDRDARSPRPRKADEDERHPHRAAAGFQNDDRSRPAGTAPNAFTPHGSGPVPGGDGAAPDTVGEGATFSSPQCRARASGVASSGRSCSRGRSGRPPGP